MNIDLTQVRRFCMYVHEGQTRKHSGEAYATHPFRCEAVLARYPDVTLAMSAAMLLHDGPEDWPDRCPLELIEMLFGSAVRRYVDELTNDKHGPEKLPRGAQKAKDREKLSRVSKEAKLMKLIDRQDNVQSIIRDIARGNLTDPQWPILYCTESKLLLPCIADGHPGLAAKLEQDITFLEGQACKLAAHQ